MPALQHAMEELDFVQDSLRRPHKMEARSAWEDLQSLRPVKKLLARVKKVGSVFIFQGC